MQIIFSMNWAHFNMSSDPDECRSGIQSAIKAGNVVTLSRAETIFIILCVVICYTKIFFPIGLPLLTLHTIHYK